MENKPIKVLLIEDNRGDVDLIEAFLAETVGTTLPAFQLVHADCLKTGLVHLNEAGIDVILLDLSLPDSYGFETFTRLYSQVPTVPIIILTGLNDEKLAFQAMQAGGQDYLIKGQIDGHILGKAIRYAIERQQMLTQLKQQTLALMESEVRLHNIIEHNADAIIIVDRQGIICFVNPAAEALFSRPAGDLVGQSFGFPTIVDEIIEFGIPADEQHEQVRVAEMHMVETIWDEEAAFLATLRDISERKRIEALKNDKEAAEAANQAKSKFLASMSHELRTPLNAIIGFSEILANNEMFPSGTLTDRQTRYVNNIHNAGRHLLQLINDILDLSRVEAGQTELRLSEIAMGATLQDIINIVQPLAAKKKISLKVDSVPGLPQITADEKQVKQIFYNLLSNAIKFTPDSGRVTVKIGVVGEGVTNAPNCLRISVSDTGIGLKPEDHERIFGTFEQVDSTYNRQQQGTGLGLALTRQLVELHGGRIWLTSEGLGQGTTFTFTLPLVAQEQVEQIAGESGSASLIQPAGSVSSAHQAGDTRPVVLVVEDDPSANELLVHYLTEAGYKVVSAIDGQQALQMARDLQPDAITLDMLLPFKGGWEVLAELKTSPETADIPVIVVSVTENSEQGLKLGAREWFVKPVNREQLVKVLRQSGVAAKNRDSTVLVIDDDPGYVELLCNLLHGQGHEVLTAYGGQPGIEMALKHQPDAIILDLLMPEVSGFEVVRQLKTHTQASHIPIIICTSQDLSLEEQQLLTQQVQVVASKSEPGWESLHQNLQRLVKARRNPNQLKTLV